MLIQQEFTHNGLLFSPVFHGKALRFPLEKLKKEILQDPDWNLLNLLEQLYFQNFLEESNADYLLTPENFYALDSDSKAELPLPGSYAQLCIVENGNIGSKQYSFSWYLLIHGKNAGRSRRIGFICTAGGKSFLLHQEHYALIREIESWKDDNTFEGRARFQAKCKYLAQKANVQISQFTQQREFLFADNADIDVRFKDAQTLEINPVLEGIPQIYADALDENIRKINSLTTPDGRTAHIFISPDTVQKYQAISKIPDIHGSNIPRFVDNPLSFLPEQVDFDSELFSKRVKGLKIRISSAAPRIQIEPNDNGDWFEYKFSIGITENSEDSESDEGKVNASAELEKLILEAAQENEEYVFYKGNWIKINPREQLQYDQARQEISQEFPDGVIPQKALHQILDIYQNLNSVEYNEFLHNLLATYRSDYVPPTISFRGELRDYQKAGYQFLRNHYDSKTGVLLADDMGLGKTVQIIALLAYMKDRNELAPALLIMPLSLIGNWKSEIKKFLPSVRNIYIHKGAHRFRQTSTIRQFDIVITTYETLARDQAFLGLIRWSCVICDEVQKVKNFNTLAASAVKGMNTHCRIAMTGTPVENRLSELWSIVDFVQPGLLASYRSFKNKFEIPIQKRVPNHQELENELIDRLSPIFLRRLKEIVLAGKLPTKTENTYSIEISQSQASLYHTLIDEMHQSDENIALGTIQKLLMVCSHPRLVTKQSGKKATASQLEKESPKLAWTIQKLREIKKKHEKVLIFTRYIGMQAILRQAIFEEFGIDAQIINGEVKGDRLAMIKRFEAAPGFSVMILSPKAAGVGLNITAANHVIHYTREWNPAVEDQATDRAYRLGQDRPVTVYYPVLDSDEFTSVEKRLDTLLTQKRQLMKSVIIPTNLEIKAESFYDLLS